MTRETNCHQVKPGALLRTRAALTSFALVILLAGFIGTTTAHADVVGDVIVCYYTNTECSAYGVATQLDGPVFIFTNTGTQNITSATFYEGGSSSISVPTIVAGSYQVIMPGLTNTDGTGFFQYTGTLLDTSDLGPNANDTQFEFTGFYGGTSLDPSVFTPATSIQPTSNDGTVTDINFLGGPDNTDGPCGDCYGPTVVATINTNGSSVPEPNTLMLLGIGLAGAGLVRYKRNDV